MDELVKSVEEIEKITLRNSRPASVFPMPAQNLIVQVWQRKSSKDAPSHF